MLKPIVLTTALLAFGATSALSCSYQKSVQTPAPVATAPADQTPIPAGQEKDVAEVDTKKTDDAKPN